MRIGVVTVAHHKQAKKRIKQTETKRVINKVKVSRARSAIKALREAIATKNKEQATALLNEVQSILSKLAKSGTMKSNNSSRVTSRLASQTAKL